MPKKTITDSNAATYNAYTLEDCTKLRVALGLSENRLAEIVGLSKYSLHKVLRGKGDSVKDDFNFFLIKKTLFYLTKEPRIVQNVGLSVVTAD